MAAAIRPPGDVRGRCEGLANLRRRSSAHTHRHTGRSAPSTRAASTRAASTRRGPGVDETSKSGSVSRKSWIRPFRGSGVRRIVGLARRGPERMTVGLVATSVAPLALAAVVTRSSGGRRFLRAFRCSRHPATRPPGCSAPARDPELDPDVIRAAHARIRPAFTGSPQHLHDGLSHATGVNLVLDGRVRRPNPPHPRLQGSRHVTGGSGD